MRRMLKAIVALGPSVAWSYTLWHYIIFPDRIPDLLKQPGFSKLLMLDPYGHITFSSYLFAVMFLAFVVLGVIALLTNRFGRGWAEDQ